MKKWMNIIILSLVFLSSCAGMPDNYPKDFSLVLEWDTGALPPEYHYQYTITIGPGPQGEFIYHPGYEENPSLEWITKFEVDESDLQSLYTNLKDNNILRNRWESSQPLLGGQGTRIIIDALGQQYVVPSISEVNPKDRDLIEQTIELIRAFVPEHIWSEMERRQAAYESSFYE
jgi:hypothetical protein